MACASAVFLHLTHCSPYLRTCHFYLLGGSESWLLIEFGGGKVESISQIYGLDTLLNLWYEQILIDDSVQIRSLY